MTISDTLMILAVLVAPFLAVFVQKQIERWRSKEDSKLWVFRTLMSTRGANLSLAHVQALNTIDLAFSDKKQAEKQVKQTWKEYLDHLRSLSSNPEQAELALWKNKSDDFLADLLVKMGKCLGYDFDKVYIKKGIYSPEGHALDELEQRAIKLYILKLLKGERSLPIKWGNGEAKGGSQS